MAQRTYTAQISVYFQIEAEEGTPAAAMTPEQSADELARALKVDLAMFPPFVGLGVLADEFAFDVTAQATES